MKYLKWIVLSMLLVNCISKKNVIGEKSADFKLDTLTYFDSARNRKVPIAVYQPKNEKIANNIPIIFSHGWGENQGGDYLRYSYLTEALATKGFFVVSIQQELSTDEMLAMDGKLQVTRRPNWERGAENIRFVLDKIKKEFPNLTYKKSVLIGHSNGGDMTVLFAHKYPHLVHKIISMDNRRMELPRCASPKIYTLRSNDFPADEGVLPTEEEKKKFGIVVDFTPINHSNMDNDAMPEERNYMINKVVEYLND